MARIISLLLVALFAGVASAVVVPPSGQCGGTSTKKGVATVLGGAWAGYECQDGYMCKAQNPFYVQCVPVVVKTDKRVVLPKATPGVIKGCTYIQKYLTQCAGVANTPKGFKTGVEKWPGVCCAKGMKCKRQNKFYSQCRWV